MKRCVFVAGLIAGCAFLTPALAQAPRIYDNDVVEAYEYILGRLLVLRREAAGLKEGFKWNEIVHREPDAPSRPDPNFDVVISEAWIGIDETSCTIIDLPEIKDRYYTVEIMNGWGEVTANLNERTFPKHPYGRFALCLKGASIVLPKDPPPPRAPREAKSTPPKGPPAKATQPVKVTPPPPPPVRPAIQRVDLPNRKSRIVLRIELGENAAEAVALQKQVALRATGIPKIDKAVVEPIFTDAKLPGVEAFDKAEEVLASEDDINNGVSAVQDATRAIAKAVADPAERSRIDEVIRKRAIPYFLSQVARIDKTTSGWTRLRLVGNYRTDYETRTIANFTQFGANSGREMVTFSMLDMDGNRVFTQSFPANAQPDAKVRNTWSVTLIDSADRRVIPNALNRYTINDRSPLQENADGSLTLGFGPRLPAGVAQSNWLPTATGKRYMIVYRFYGPTKDVVDGTWSPPGVSRSR